MSDLGNKNKKVHDVIEINEWNDDDDQGRMIFHCGVSFKFTGQQSFYRI